MVAKENTNTVAVRQLGKILLKYRQAKGHSAKDAAQAIGLTPSKLCWVERGYPGISANALLFRKISDYTGIPTGILAGFCMGDLTESDLAVFEVAHFIPDNRIRSVLNFIYAVLATVPLKRLKEIETMSVASIVESKIKIADMPDSIKHYLVQRSLNAYDFSGNQDLPITQFSNKKAIHWSDIVLDEDKLPEPAPRRKKAPPQKEASPKESAKKKTSKKEAPKKSVVRSRVRQRSVKS